MSIEQNHGTNPVSLTAKPKPRTPIGSLRAPVRTRNFRVEPIPHSAARALTAKSAPSYFGYGPVRTKSSFVIFSRPPVEREGPVSLVPAERKRKRPNLSRNQSSVPTVTPGEEHQAVGSSQDTERLSQDAGTVLEGGRGEGPIDHVDALISLLQEPDSDESQAE